MRPIVRSSTCIKSNDQSALVRLDWDALKEAAMTAADLDDLGRNVRSAAIGDRQPISQAARRWRPLALISLLSGVLMCLPAWGHAAGLDCPEIGPPRAVPNLLTDVQAKLVASGNSIDLTNEIYDLINRLQIEKPNLSYAELTNVLIAAYCPVVASMPGLSAAEKWHRMQQFDALLRQQLAANMTPAGTLIIANVPLPPAVYRELRSQAARINQTPSQFMAAILARAAGK